MDRGYMFKLAGGFGLGYMVGDIVMTMVNYLW